MNISSHLERRSNETVPLNGSFFMNKRNGIQVIIKWYIMFGLVCVGLFGLFCGMICLCGMACGILGLIEKVFFGKYTL